MHFLPFPGWGESLCDSHCPLSFETRLRRYKRKLKSHHANGSVSDAEEISYRVVASVSDDDEVPEDFAPAIVAESTVALATMSVAAAVIELDIKDYEMSESAEATLAAAVAKARSVLSTKLYRLIARW